MSSKLDELSTKHAVHARDLARTFNEKLGAQLLGPGDYAPELTMPEGQSTGGGVQSLQHVRLVPKKEGFHTLVIGNVDRNARKARMRTFERVDAMHHERWGGPVELDNEAYEELCLAAKELFATLEIETERVDTAEEPPAAEPAKTAPKEAAPEDNKSFPWLIVVALLVLVGIASVLFALRR